MVEIKIGKKEAGFFVSVLLFVFVASVVIAYNSGGPASSIGHSSEELEVNISGGQKTLQQAIDDGDLGSGGGGPLGSSSFNLTQNGHHQFENGLIIQWGKTPNLSSGGPHTIYYPIPFPNEVFNVEITGPPGVEWTDDYVTNVGSVTFRIYNGNNFQRSFYWFAVGH